MSILPVTDADRADWAELWRGYLHFYEESLPEAVTDDVFARLVRGDALRGAVARDEDGAALGLVHWLLHPSTWSIRGYCYLEDLFVAPERRGSGTGRALIAHVRDRASEAGADKVYWLTRSSNATARALYDRVATSTGFVHYEIPLDG